MPFSIKINLDFRSKIIENPIKNVSKTRLKTYIDFFIEFSSPGGACRPGFARETERADAKSCDSHALFEDYGVISCSILLTVA